MSILQDKKRKTWYFRVYVVDKFGLKKQKCKSGFKTKKDAKIAEINFLQNYNSNYENLTFQELYNIYIKSKKQDLKPQSFRSIESRFRLYILPFFKDYKISKINNELYRDWKDYILSFNFSYKYNSNLHRCMVSIFNYAIDFYDLDKNIASKVGNFSKIDYKPNVNYWTYNEFIQFISVVDDKIYYTLFYTLYFTGLRIGECLALTWNDLEDNYIIINKTLAKEKNNGNYIITKPKTQSSNRKIKLDINTYNLIIELRKYYNDFVGFSNNWFIFGGLYALSQSSIGRRKDKYCELANVKKIRIHDFRHSHATLLLSKGVPITVISNRLGHSSIAMTLGTYSHLVPTDEERAIDILNNL